MADPDGNTQAPSLGDKLGAAWAQLAYLPRAASLVWAASRGWTAAWMAVLLVQGLLPVGTVLLTRRVVDGVVGAVGGAGTWEAVWPLLVPAGLMAGLLVLSELSSGLLGVIRGHQEELIRDHISALIHDTSTAVDLAFYDAPEYYDHLHRARNEAWYRPQRLVDNTGRLVQSGITLVAMAAVLFGFGAWVPLVLLLSTLPALHVVLRHAIRQHRWRLENTSKERHGWYYDWEMTSSTSAAEIRMFGLGDHFKRLYRAVRAGLRREQLSLSRDQSLAQMAASLVALLAAAACVGWMGWRTIRGELTLGELALFYAAFRQGQEMLRSLLGNVGDIYRNILFLGDLFEFLGLSPSIRAPEAPAPVPGGDAPSIRFEDVSFAYPGADGPVLDGFSLDLPAGKVSAIVGPNGSGKSTLVKLMCRLYDPTAGRVTRGDVDLRRFDPGALRRATTILFQEPVKYNLTAAENIRLGDLEAPQSRVDGAAAAAGATEMVTALPRGFETVLGKWFDGGCELSVGQWQRIALARAFLRDSPVVLLDEPTSAMDSWAEAEWMDRLRGLVAGRTSVVVTHRFTTAMRADVIFVMMDGRIAESGTHAELVAAGGAYAASWRAQMSAAGVSAG